MSRSQLWNKLKSINSNTTLKYRNSSVADLKKEINNFRRQEIEKRNLKNTFKSELRAQVNKYKKQQFQKLDIKNIKNFFNKPINNNSIIINRNNYIYFKRYSKFYPEFQLLENNGDTFRIRKPLDNFKFKILQQENVYGSDADIEYQLLHNNIDNINLKWIKKSKERRNGAFFPYYNKTNLDLSNLQIYKENQNQSNLNCLQYALKQGGLKEKEFNKLLTLFIKDSESCNLSNNDYIPKCKLKEIAEKLNITIKLSYERQNDNRCRIQKFGTKGNIYNIGLLCNHYFLNKETKFTKKDFGIINTNTNRHYSKLTSFKLIQLLLEYKETLLISITHHNNKSPYNFKDLKNYQTLYNPKKCNCEINIDGIDKIKNLRETLCNNKCGSDIKLIKATTQKIPSIFSIKTKQGFEDLEFEIGFFDFEASTDGEKHKAYQIAYKNRNGQKAFFQGEHCAIKFLKSLKTHIMLFAHNLKYDLQFIIQYLCRHSQFIKTGSQFKTISGEFYNKDTDKYIKLCFKDSMSVIPESLSKFGKMFNLEQSKEIIPYELYTENNIKLNSISINSAKQYLSDEDYIDFQKNIKKWNLELPNNNFNHMKYSKIYCEMDVEVLSLGYERMKDWMFKITKLNLDLIISLPQLAYKFGVNEGVFNNCFSLSGQSREFIQRCLVGGRTMTRDNKKHHIKSQLQDFDGVSLYPSAMVEMDGVLKGTPKVLESNQLSRIRRCY